MKKFTGIILFLCASCFAYAQPAPMETDRPGQSYTPHTTIPGAFQLEMGLSETYQKQAGEKERDFLYPTAHLKYGITKKLEVSVHLQNESDYDFVPARHKTKEGLRPLQLGLKYNLLEEMGALPSLSVITAVTFPKIASPDFKSDFVAPSFILALENSLFKHVSLVYNAGIQWEPDDVHAQYLYTLAPQIDLSEKLKIFGEVYGIFEEGHLPDHRLDAGLAYNLKPTLQLDVLAGTGISRSSPDNFLELGCSFRF